jgi:hypothetical protein
VDGIAWAMRQSGVPIDNPVMGSDWMRQNGLTAPVEPGVSSVIGDTIGMVSPMAFTKEGGKALMKAITRNAK